MEGHCSTGQSALWALKPMEGGGGEDINLHAKYLLLPNKTKR